MRTLTLLLLSLTLASATRAQDGSNAAESTAAERLPLALAVGPRITDRPQLALHLYPSERFEVAFSAYSNDWESGIGTNWYGSVSALVRFHPQEPLSFRLGVNYTHDERARLAGTHPTSDFDAGPPFQPYRWAGPLLGLDYAISDRLTAFADFVVGIDIDIQTVTMNNTGIGLLYRIKKP
jgi:hypothetical protein